MKIEVIVPEITLGTVVADVFGVDDEGEAFHDGVETVGDKVAKLIAQAVMKSPEYTSLRDRVTQIRTEEIRAGLQPIIREALERPIRKTNRFGESTGGETTLSEIIMEEAKRAWDTRPGDRYNQAPTVGDTIQAEVRKQIGAEVQKAVKQAQDAALKAIGDLAGAPVVEAVKKALGR